MTAGRAAVVVAVLTVSCAACSEEPVPVPPPGAAVAGGDTVASPPRTGIEVPERRGTTTAADAPETARAVREPVWSAPGSTMSAAVPEATADPAPVADDGGSGAEAAVSTVPTAAGSERPWPPEWPYFVEAVAPEWPFRGLVQLWPDYGFVEDVDGGRVGLRLSWSLRYWSWGASADGSYPQVQLPGLRIECLGQVALVYDEHGVEVGGAPGAASAAFRVPWGGAARELSVPSQALVADATQRHSNVAVSSVGDWVRLGSGEGARSYAMRDPARVGGEHWRARARHDGELLMLTVHPAHLPCYSGVTWLSVAETGEFVMCGANSAATVFVTLDGAEPGELALPDPEQTGDYLTCAPQLDLEQIPLTPDRLRT